MDIKMDKKGSEHFFEMGERQWKHHRKNEWDFKKKDVGVKVLEQTS